MGIYIDKTKCIGCGRCVEICPGNLLTLKDRAATIRDVRDCWGCTACVKACPKNAICYRLAADLGGAGSELYAIDKENTLTWLLKHPTGTERKVIIDKTQANRY